MKERGFAISSRHPQEHLLVTLDVGLFSAEPLGEDLLCPRGWEPFLEIHQYEFIKGLLFVRSQGIGCRNLRSLPIFCRPEQVGGGIRSRVADPPVGQRYWLQEHIGHEGPRMIAGRLTKPTVQPGRTPRIGCHLCADSREVRAIGAHRFGEISMLMAGQAATNLHHLFAPFEIGRRSDAGIGLHVFKRLARTLQVGDHRANLKRLVPHGLLQALALEMLPEPEEPRHLRRRPEILWITQPGVKPVKTNLAGHVTQRRPHLRERARGFGILEKAGELMTARRKLGNITRGRIAVDEISKTFPRLAPVRARTDILHPASCCWAKGREASVGGERLGDLVVIGRQTHVGPDPLVWAGPAVDFVAPVAAILANQLIALDEFGRGGFRKSFAGFEINDLVVALQAARFLEPLRKHWINPMMIVSPTILIVPLVPLLGRICRVR